MNKPKTNMSNVYGNMHRLRLLNFNSGYNVNERSEKSFKIFNTSYANNTRENVKLQICNSTDKNPDCVKVQSLSETSLQRRRSHLVNNVFNNILRKSSIISHKKPVHKRSVSLNDLKLKVSSNSVIVSDRIKQTIQSVTSQAFLKRKRKRKRKHKTHPFNEAKTLINDDNFQVLFKRNKSTEKVKKQNICTDCQRLDLLYDTKSSGEMFGFNSNGLNSCYQLFNCYNKRHFQTCNCDHQNAYFHLENQENCRSDQIDDLSNYPPVSYGYTMPVRYNLINFPCNNFQVYDTEPRPSKSCVHKNSFHSPKKQFSLAKSTLKYILFGVTVIVWFPCIVVAVLYWLIIYPLRPHHVFQDDIDKEEKCYNCTSCIECGHNFLHFIGNLINRVAKKICTLYNAFHGQTHKHKSLSLRPSVSRTSLNRHLSRNHRRCLHPDAKYKYTLYYTRHRGWKMKPLHKRSKSIKRINSNRYCECHSEEFENSESKENKDLKNKTHLSQDSNFKSNQTPFRKRSQTITIINRYCECHSDDFKNFEKDHMKNKEQDLLNKTDLSQASNLKSDEKHIKDRISSPIRELQSRKTYLKSNMPLPSREGYKRTLMNPSKNVSFKGNVPKYMDANDKTPNTKFMSPRLSMREPLHYKPPFPKPCQCTYYQRMLKKNQCPILSIKKPRPGSFKKYESKGKTFSRKYENKGKKLSKRQKVRCWYQTVRKKIGDVINDVEGQAWKGGDICEDMFVHTLRRRPCFWIYRCSPTFYPYFLTFYKLYQNVVLGLMFIISTCIWCPLLCWCYICYNLICRCMC